MPTARSRATGGSGATLEASRERTKVSEPSSPGAARRPFSVPAGQPSRQPDSLADLLERVLDKGIIIAGDVRVNLLDIELLTIKIRLLIVSVDKAEQMGIDWWRRDPMLTSSEQGLADENRSEEHTSELQSHVNLVCRLLL